MKQQLNCVMVIDDDEPTSFFNQMMLEESNCARDIKIMQSGQQALDYLAESAVGDPDGIFPGPDLIFLDINMPAMDGWEFLKKYRNLAVQQPVVVIMLTTLLFPADELKRLEIPEISGFELKPLTKEKIESILKNHFANVATSC